MTQHTHVHRHHNEAMLSVEEALERILSFFHVLEPEEKPILDALGQVLAEDAVSQYDIPPLDNSAMDGYAVQATSVVGASEDSPVTLRVVGSVAAGELPPRRPTLRPRPSELRGMTASWCHFSFRSKTLTSTGTSSPLSSVTETSRRLRP